MRALKAGSGGISNRSRRRRRPAPQYIGKPFMQLDDCPDAVKKMSREKTLREKMSREKMSVEHPGTWVDGWGGG